MLSLTAVLASLPPASLAETDLPRFVAQALGRRTRQDLPGLASLFSEETLRGFPPGLGAVLASACDALYKDHLDPQLLDSRAADALLGSRAFIASLETRIEVRRQRLRPGTLVTGELRQTLGMRLTILPGVGRELMLVAPVDLAQVPDARYAMPLTVVVARPGSAAEGEVYRTHWAILEEAFGLSGPEAERWTARFFAIARRENHDARLVKDGLLPLAPETRRRLFDTLVGHFRDGELPEQHRPGRRGLEGRLSALGLELDRPWMEPLIGLVEATYRAAGLDPDVTAGRPPCPREDLVRWAGWVDVPQAQKKLLLDLDPTVIEQHLVALAEIEMGRADGLVDDALRRPLASLRDGCLRPRWQRSQAALLGIDPLLLAEARIASGDDRQTIPERLAALAAEATATLASRPATEPAPRPRPARAAARASTQASPPAHPSAHEPQTPAPETQTPLPEPQPLTPEPRTPAQEPEPPVTPPLTSLPEPQTPDPRPDVPAVAPPRFHLPPLPEVPPPRPAPRVRPRTELPPLPPIPPLAAAPLQPPGPPRPQPERPATLPRLQRAPTSRPITRSAGPAATPTSAPPPSPGPGPNASPNPAPRPAQRPHTAAPTTAQGAPQAAPITRAPLAAASRPRLQTTPHLVTPAQGNEFYDAAFRELELIERDLLQRGPTAQARERADALGREAKELHDALGPSARSGDREFLSAQHRLEKVLDYLERLGPLLEGEGPEPPPTLGQRLGRSLSGLFRRR